MNNVTDSVMWKVASAEQKGEMDAYCYFRIYRHAGWS